MSSSKCRIGVRYSPPARSPDTSVQTTRVTSLARCPSKRLNAMCPMKGVGSSHRATSLRSQESRQMMRPSESCGICCTASLPSQRSSIRSRVGSTATLELPVRNGEAGKPERTPHTNHGSLVAVSVVEYVLHVIVRLYVLNVELSLEFCVIAVVLRRPHEHNVPRDAVPVQPLSGLVIRVRPVEVDVLSRGHEDDLRAVVVSQNLQQVHDGL